MLNVECSPRRVPSRRVGAFTLIEILLAVAIFAIVLIAINTVFFSALRLQKRSTAALDGAQPLNQALAILRKDLRGALPPVGTLASSFTAGLVGGGTVQSLGLEFYTTTGTIRPDAPWGDVQKVTYHLAEPLNRTNARSRDLIRGITRNLTATVAEQPEEIRLAGNIESLEFKCFNGSEWRDTWDTTTAETNLPSAVLVRLLPASDSVVGVGNRKPMELLVPLTVQSSTNSTTVGAQ